MIPQIAPMLATSKPLNNEVGFIHEIKWDGYRALAYIEDSQVDLVSRNGYSLSTRFSAPIPSLKALPHQPLVLDGELIALGEEGLPVFSQLRSGTGDKGAVLYVVFDVMVFAGRNICACPWYERRTKLEELLSHQTELFLSPVFSGPLEPLLDKVRERRLEGLVSKQIDSLYLPGVRSDSWRKTKVFHRTDCVVGGIVKKGDAVRAALVGQYDNEASALLYLGRVGSGFSESDLDFLFRAQAKLKTDTSPFLDAPTTLNVVWFEPHIIVEVQYTEITPSRSFRHPVFIRYRWDKRPQQCVYSGGVGDGDY